MDVLAYAGFILVIASMLYSPVKVFIIDRKNKKASLKEGKGKVSVWELKK